MNQTDKKHAKKNAKTHKGRKHIESKLPKLVENTKKCLLLNTVNTSEIMRVVVNEIYFSRKCFSLKVNKKKKINPVFDNSEHIEKLMEKNDTTFFVYSSDTKKRPMNLVFGNTYDYRVLDAFEFEVTNFIPINYFDEKITYDLNSTPLMIFQGELFETDNIYERFKKYLLDFYAQDLLEEVNISDIRKVIVVSVGNDKKIKIRNFQIPSLGEYSIKKLKTDELTEVGPSFDLMLRRNILCPDDEYKNACRQPKSISNEESRNKINSLLDVQGKIFVSKQNLKVASLMPYDRILGKKKKINKEALEMFKEQKEQEKNKNKKEEGGDEEDDQEENEDEEDEESVDYVDDEEQEGEDYEDEEELEDDLDEEEELLKEDLKNKKNIGKKHNNNDLKLNDNKKGKKEHESLQNSKNKNSKKSR